MTIANFSYINRPPTGKRADIDNPKGLNSGVDLCLLLLGGFSDFLYSSVNLTYLQITTPYSVRVGFIYMLYQNYIEWIVDPIEVPFFTIPDVNETTHSMGFVVSGITSEAFEESTLERPREIVPAVGFFYNDYVINYLRWQAKIKPYSRTGRTFFNFKTALRFPPDLAVKHGNLRAFLAILIGDPPTELSKYPIYVTGQLNYV